MNDLRSGPAPGFRWGGGVEYRVRPIAAGELTDGVACLDKADICTNL